MRVTFTLFLFFILAGRSIGQQKDLTRITDSIVTEGETLYKSEWASWYGTDIFVDKCKDKRPISGGYISYDTGRGLNNIFFSKGDNPIVLSTISFDYSFDAHNYKLDTVTRKLTDMEMKLYIIRKKAVDEIYKDTLFKRYRNTNLNPVPIITNNRKRVYILTGPELSGVVLFGNDYLVTFDDDNNIITKQKLHKGLISIQYNKPSLDSSKTVIASIHTHLSEFSDFITATDICTLQLYEKFTTWHQHIVISKNYVSIWDCQNDKLLILTAEAFKKIYSLKDALGK